MLYQTSIPHPNYRFSLCLSEYNNNQVGPCLWKNRLSISRIPNFLIMEMQFLSSMLVEYLSLDRGIMISIFISIYLCLSSYLSIPIFQMNTYEYNISLPLFVLSQSITQIALRVIQNQLFVQLGDTSLQKIQLLIEVRLLLPQRLSVINRIALISQLMKTTIASVSKMG